MPTVILLDNSLSMIRPCQPPGHPDSSAHDPVQLLDLAKWGIDRLLDHVERHFKLEQVAVLSFSSKCVVVAPFSRDIAGTRVKVAIVDSSDTSDPVPAINAVSSYVREHWGAGGGGPGAGVTVVIVTDGRVNFDTCKNFHQNLPFEFHGSLQVVCLSNRTPEIERQFSIFFSKSGLASKLNFVDDLTRAGVESTFEKIAHQIYSPFVGTLTFGEYQKTSVAICPPPQNFKECKVSTKLDIKGFLTLADISSPPVVSRHLVLPHDTEPEANQDEVARQRPELCVFLHMALKVEGLCALVQVAGGPPNNWFGFLFSCIDKKKSNLMLALFEPGDLPVPWLGDLRRLGPATELSATTTDPFPVRSSAIKPSYSTCPVVWIKNSNMLNDIQKILRHSRKLPEKTVNFYKELNRLKKAALCIGFYELLDGVATIFEHESVNLPRNLHPECAVQLRHSANELRSKACLGVEYQITQAK